METLFFFKNMLPDEEAQLRDYFSTKMPKLEKMLSHYPGDAIILQVKGEKFDKHSAFEVELTMKMPGNTLAAKEASHMITKAVDLAKDRLVMQLKKNTIQTRRAHRGIKARGKMAIRSKLAVGEVIV